MPMKLPTSNAKKLNFRRNLVKRHKFVGYLDEWMATEPEGFEYKHIIKQDDDAWHPSSHCTPDVTELYHYAITPRTPYVAGGKMKDRTPGVNKNFVVGHFWHQLLQYGTLQLGLAKPESIEQRRVRVWGDSRKNGPLCPQCLSLPNTKFFDPEGAIVCLRGHAFWDSNGLAPIPYHWAAGAGDIAPLELPKYGEYLVDFKTMGGRAFKEVGLPTGFAEKYEAQINIYMDLFDLEKALIVGVQKDTPHEFKEIEFVRNQPLIDAIYRKWEFVSECMDVGVTPTTLDNDYFVLTDYFQGPIVQ